MHSIEVVPAEPRHVHDLAPRLRDEDRDEVLGLGHRPRQSLWRGYRNSVLCRTALVDGQVAAMWGLGVGFAPGVSLLSDAGSPWLLASPEVRRIPFAYVRLAKAEVAAMAAVKPHLYGYVAANYSAACRFLRLLGFALDEPVPLPPHGAPYRRFHYGL